MERPGPGTSIDAVLWGKPVNTAPRSTVIGETHVASRIGWLRAAVLGANDGIVSTASLIIGVAAASAQSNGIVIAGTASLVAGAMSMAAGEYVSVSAQADTEHAELAREVRELSTDPQGELAELSAIYQARGVMPDTADAVARQLMAKDALGAHARDELDLPLSNRARPIQAALASAASFVVGAAMPLVAAVVSPPAHVIPAVAGGSLVFLATLGAVSARAGRAPLVRGLARVTIWGALAMSVTALIGSWLGSAI